MSDFDREAERERLREKYEKDKEKRKSTQRMSELLLKGATMTNQHCDECGSPIFRHDGREFCPNCQGAGASAEAGTATPSEDQTAGETGGERDAPAAGGARSEAAESGENVEAADAPEAGDGVRAESSTSAGESGVETHASERTTAADATAPDAIDPERTAGSGAPGLDDDERRQKSEARPSTGAPEGREADVGGRSGADETSAGAREALLRALRTHADRAADETDPRRASDHLAAAREAAEALSALGRR